MTHRLGSEADLDRGLAHLVNADPRLAQVLAVAGRPPLRRRPAGFAGLVATMVGQQLSTASANAIWTRLAAAYDPFAPDALRRARIARLKQVGLSEGKIRALKALATELATGAFDLDALALMDADDAHRVLVARHGIGPWTADSYLLFCLGHADAWPAGDLALREALRLALALAERPSVKAMGPLAEPWRPWRGVAALLLWSYYRAVKRRDPTSFNHPRKPDARCKEANVAAELDGPRIEPRSRGPARQLVVFLHGYGADGNDLIEIGRMWQDLLPDAAFVSPHAPRPCGQAPVGREWFPLTFREANERWTGVNAAGPLLDRFLDQELRRRNLPPTALALVGFSQGTMMALHVGLRRAVAPAAIVGYSGIFVLPDGAAPDSVKAEIRVRPPILLLHGSEDELIPAQALFLAIRDLAALAIPVEWHISYRMGHGIDPEGLRQGGEFLARRFGGR